MLTNVTPADSYESLANRNPETSITPCMVSMQHTWELTLTSDLRWNKHIANITHKANQMLDFQRRNQKINYNPPSNLWQIGRAHV